MQTNDITGMLLWTVNRGHFKSLKEKYIYSIFHIHIYIIICIFNEARKKWIIYRPHTCFEDPVVMFFYPTFPQYSNGWSVDTNFSLISWYCMLYCMLFEDINDTNGQLNSPSVFSHIRHTDDHALGGWEIKFEESQILALLYSGLARVLYVQYILKRAWLYLK